MNYWLMKSEPDVFSIDDLKKDKTTLWDGVRNYQARNFMRDQMKKGDKVLFYHSNTKPPGVAGLATISKVGLPDPSAFDKKSRYFDPKSDPENPRWICAEVKYAKTFKNYISLDQIRETPKLSGMMVIKKGMRLSIQPVDEKDYQLLVKMGQA